MIKFFRKIRQKMLTENKFTKYLFYAIGEILLVVIGILIALWINNWNENRKNNNIEARYIKSLQEQLVIQIEVIDDQIKEEDSYIRSAEYVLENLDQAETVKTKFDEIFYTNLTHLNKRTTFKVIDATYIDLISTGKLDLFSDDDTKNEIIAYYQELEKLESVIQNNNIQIVDNIFAPTVQRIGLYLFNTQNDLTIENHPSSNILKSFDSDLAIFSNNLILKKHNKLTLVNLLKQRLVVGIFHSEAMKEMRLKTLALHEELESMKR